MPDLSKQTGWKVVSKNLFRAHNIEDIEFYYRSATNHISSIIYKERKWATPHLGNGPLSVFSDKEVAINFARFYGNKAVFKCEYYPSTHDKIWCVGNYGGIKYGHEEICYRPEVRLATAVKLLERVW